VAELHGKPLTARVEEYESPEEYSGQGDTRIVRDLMFAYTTSAEDAAGFATIDTVDVTRGTELSVDDMGLLALAKGEKNHSFYTDDEREALESGQNPDAPQSLAGESEVSEMGEYELAEYIKGNNPSGKQLTVDETIALAGDDKDLAHRLLQAENIATDGDPRKGVETGLTSVIES
jgi:hypothetical protein